MLIITGLGRWRQKNPEFKANPAHQGRERVHTHNPNMQGTQRQEYLPETSKPSCSTKLVPGKPGLRSPSASSKQWEDVDFPTQFCI